MWHSSNARGWAPRNDEVITCLATIVSLIAIPVNADQKAQRTQFERGRTSAVVKGTVTNSEQENVHQYKLRVNKGQTIIVHLASPEKVCACGKQ